MIWTRKHDAWLARECEELEVQKERGLPEYLWRYKRPDGCLIALPSYATDPAACIRAAEAWAAKDSEHRTWSLHRAGTLLGQCMDDGYYFSHEGEDGLAWALYKATGGPA